MYIESPHNPKVHRWSQLKSKKGRVAQTAFLVEGMRLVEDLLRSSFEVEAVLWDVSTDTLPDTLTEAAQERGVPVVEVAPTAFAQVSDTVTPQGVLAVAKHPVVQVPAAQVRFGLVLDNLRDPGNVGTLVRSADAFGAELVHCGTGTVDPYSPKVVRASMGGTFRVPMQTGNTAEFVQRWRGAWPDGRVVLADAKATIDCDQFDFCLPVLVVIGGEAFGASAETAVLATDQILIPMTGMADSLNAGVAGSVLLYEVNRQRRVRSAPPPMS